MGHVSDAPPALVTPAACPACRSPEILAQAKQVSAGSYWRCKACGEVWNVGRWREQPPARRW